MLDPCKILSDAWFEICRTNDYETDFALEFLLHAELYLRRGSPTRPVVEVPTPRKPYVPPPDDRRHASLDWYPSNPYFRPIKHVEIRND